MLGLLTKDTLKAVSVNDAPAVTAAQDRLTAARAAYEVAKADLDRAVALIEGRIAGSEAEVYRAQRSRPALHERALDCKIEMGEMERLYREAYDQAKAALVAPRQQDLRSLTQRVADGLVALEALAADITAVLDRYQAMGAPYVEHPFPSLLGHTQAQREHARQVGLLED